MDFTLLTENQIWGDGALEVMKRYGTKVAPTDLTVILGGWMSSRGDRTSEGDLTCASWSASSAEYVGVRCVSERGYEGWSTPNNNIIYSVRPALPPSEASKISPSIARAINGIFVAEYGEYPQTVADDVTCERLERLHDSRSLRLSGKNYTFDSVDLDDSVDSNGYITSFKATSYPEYEMDGKRYIRVPGRHAEDGKLSTGEQVKEGKPYWVEVQPIEWLMDKSGWMVSKKCLFAGVQFDRNAQYYGDFKKTFMKHYLDTYFAKEMEPAERVAVKETSRSLAESKIISLLHTLKINKR